MIHVTGEFVINSSNFFFASPLRFCALCSRLYRSVVLDINQPPSLQVMTWLIQIAGSLSSVIQQCISQYIYVMCRLHFFCHPTESSEVGPQAFQHQNQIYNEDCCIAILNNENPKSSRFRLLMLASIMYIPGIPSYGHMHEVQAQPVQRILEALACFFPYTSITCLYYHLYVVTL